MSRVNVINTPQCNESVLVKSQGCLVATGSQRRLGVRAVALFCAAVLISGCGEGGPNIDSSGQPQTPDSRPMDDDHGTSYSEKLSALQSHADLLESPPELMAVEVLSGSGLQVGVAVGLESSPSFTYIEQQWTAMQSCTGESGKVPLLIMVNAGPSPLTASDDVMIHLDGSVAATSTLLDEGAVMQIAVDDINGDLLNSAQGFYLRSIFARTLWTQAGNAERNYPYNCPIDGY